jgi:hypothetical protein
MMFLSLHLLLLLKTTQWIPALSNFAFVTAAFAIFAVVTFYISDLCCRYVSIAFVTLASGNFNCGAAVAISAARTV